MVGELGEGAGWVCVDLDVPEVVGGCEFVWPVSCVSERSWWKGAVSGDVTYEMSRFCNRALAGMAMAHRGRAWGTRVSPSSTWVVLFEPTMEPSNIFMFPVRICHGTRVS